MKILMVEPFCTGSHQAWLEGYQRHSQHKVKVLSLSGRHWKWRMHGGAVSLARKYREMDFQADVMVVTDMLDLTTFLALGRKKLSSIPVVLYMHENQLTYPWSPEDEDVPRNRDRHYGFINYASALTADEVWFNSAHHKNVFLDALPDFLRAFPDYREPTTVREIERKSRVMSIGLDLSFEPQEAQNLNPKPTILWNHRWEYDKGPEPFFEALFALQEEGLAFELIVLGESYGRKPEIFAQAEERLADRIVQWGFADSRYEYWQWLDRADILPVSSWHDFFGVSVVEAINRNCYPLLPNRLAYPEHVPAECLYEEGELLGRLRNLIQHIDWVRSRNTSGWVQRYDWSEMAPQYDARLKQLVQQHEDVAQTENWTEIH